MKILVFSDTHLYDEFDQKKFDFLKKIISQADRVIINGDFWDRYVCEFSDFINSSWKDLFPLLKTKQTVYIYGNHDKKICADHRVSLFSDLQVERYVLKIQDKTYIIEHGNHYDILLSRLDYIFHGNNKNIKSPFFLTKKLKNIAGEAMQTFGRLFLKPIYQIFNEELKSKIKDKIQDNHFFVFGHTHTSEIDMKNHFINTGFIQYGLGQYLFISENGFELKKEKY